MEGVASLVGHREITSVADLQAGLDLSSSTQHTFRTTTYDRTDGYNRLQDPGSSGSSRKRKSSDDHTRPPTRRRSNSQKSTLGQAYDQSSEANGEANGETTECGESLAVIQGARGRCINARQPQANLKLYYDTLVASSFKYLLACDLLRCTRSPASKPITATPAAMCSALIQTLSKRVACNDQS